MTSGTADDYPPPPGLFYAEDAPDLTAVKIAATCSHRQGESLVVVIEPGHDANLLWRRLRMLLKDEGLLYAAPTDPPSSLDPSA